MAAIAFAILPLVPLAIWFLLVGWSPNNTEGTLLQTVPVPLLARLKMLALPLATGLVVLITSLIMGRLPWWMTGVHLLMYAVVISIPISYTLTSTGIRTGKGVFRRWTEFAGVRRSPNGVTLQGGQRAASYPIFLSGSREDDEFVHTLRILVRDSYKGKSAAFRPSGTQSEGDTSTTSSISH